MALITNNISGSSSDGSKIGITGSIIISNSPDAQFPSLGSDAVFFVSGSESAKTVLGGAAKISGSLSTDGNVTLGNSSDDVTTITGISTFQRSASFNAGLSGSLTKLTDGTSYLIAGSNVTITTGSNGAITIDSTGGGGGGAPTGAQYVTLATNASLTDERVLTAGTGISLTDAGAGSTVTLAVRDSVVATVSGTQFTGNVGVTGSLGASTLNILSGVLYQANGTIQQDANLVWDSANDRLGIGTNAPAKTLHIGPAAGTSFRLGPNSSYIEIGQANSTTYRWSSGGTATTIEQNVNHIFQNSNTLGFQSSNGQPADIGFGRSAAGILIVSGAAPGAILRFNAASTPLAAGDLSMNTTTGRPGAFIGGAARSLAHTDEIPGTFFSSTTAGAIFTTGSLAIRGGESAVDAPADKGADVFFYVSGSTNITGSNAKLSLFGGDVTISGSANIANGATVVGNLTAVNNVGVLGALTVMSTGLIAGNATVSGSLTANTLFVTTGNVVGAPGTGNNALSLLSSGNIVMQLDVNNDAAGHKFDVQNYLGTSQFFVGENGNAELSGTLVVSGSTLSTVASTFNLINTAATTVNFAGAASKISVGGATSTGSIGGNLEVTGSTSLGLVVENILPSNGGTGVVSFNLNNQSIFYVNGPAGNITANFTNVPTVDNRIISTTVILSQSATARIVSAVQIAGVASTINWANNVTPTGNSGKQDVFGFSLIRSGSAWKTLGQMSTYG